MLRKNSYTGHRPFAFYERWVLIHMLKSKSHGLESNLKIWKCLNSHRISSQLEMNTEQLWLNWNCIWIIFLGSRWHDLLTLSPHGKPQKVEERVHSEGCMVIWDNGVREARTWKLVEKVQVDSEESWHFYDQMGLLIPSNKGERRKETFRDDLKIEGQR